MQEVPRNRESLLPYNHHEQRAIAALRRKKWVAPRTSTSSRLSFHGPISSPTSIPTPKIYHHKRDPTPSALQLPLELPKENNDALSKNITGSDSLVPFSPSYCEISIIATTHVKGNSDSEYSDDLYGTGRPLRPNLINTKDKVQEWRLSAIGNPELSVTFDKEFTPNDHKGLGIKKETQKPDRIGFLIPMNEKSSPKEQGDVLQGGSVSGEDHSILADLNVLFSQKRGQILDEPSFDYGCISNEETEVESEDDETDMPQASPEDATLVANEDSKAKVEGETPNTSPANFIGTSRCQSKLDEESIPDGTDEAISTAIEETSPENEERDCAVCIEHITNGELENIKAVDGQCSASETAEEESDLPSRSATPIPVAEIVSAKMACRDPFSSILGPVASVLTAGEESTKDVDLKSFLMKSGLFGAL